MNFLDLILANFGFQSFSNLWYWVIVIWAVGGLPHRPLGVPDDVIIRAHSGDRVALADMHMMLAPQARHMTQPIPAQDIIATASGMFALSALATLGWGYGVGVAQAGFLILLPLMIKYMLAKQVAQHMIKTTFQTALDDLRRYQRHLRLVRFVCLFATAFWAGVFVVLSAV
jgi:hypothetical protein